MSANNPGSTTGAPIDGTANAGGPGNPIDGANSASGAASSTPVDGTPNAGGPGNPTDGANSASGANPDPGAPSTPVGDITDKGHLYRLRGQLPWFTWQFIAGLILLLLLTTIELFYLKQTHGAPGNIIQLLLTSWLNTAIAWLMASPILLVIFLLTSLLSIRIAKIILFTLFTILLLGHLVLTNYFSTALVPLGADLYGYSWNDIKQTVGAAGGVKVSFILTILITTLAAVTLFYVAGRRSQSHQSPWLSASLVALGAILLITGWQGITIGETEFTRNLVIDKTGFFLHQSWQHFFPEDQDTDIYADNYIAGGDASGNGFKHRYIAENTFPFLHDDTAADVLSPFFRKDDREPNIVIILVEGLGRAFTNEGAYLGNFTPFIDSLSRKSLYWDNFLSEGGRTFAALPSVLGSLPFAKNGFLELGKDMPPTLTLLNILQANGYHSSFYYGGDASFDNMALLLRSNHIDELNDEKSFPTGYTKIPADNGFTWGYNDQELFRWFLNSRPENTSTTPGPANASGGSTANTSGANTIPRNLSGPANAGTPQLSVLLTVSTHSPFHLNNPEQGNALFEARMTQLGLDETAKREHRLYKDQYATILYTDNALRNFFAAYSKRPDFAHTVFLITGDHRMPEIPMRDKIDRYHVPLIVYSPLLQRTATFHSVSTHFDLTPSLLAWLSHSYQLKRPTTGAWMGDGLDTTRQLQNIHSYPLMQTKTDLVDFIQGPYHLNGTTAFRLLDDLNETPISEDSIRESLSGGMTSYQQRNTRWLQNGKLLPDTLIQRYQR